MALIAGLRRRICATMAVGGISLAALWFGASAAQAKEGPLYAHSKSAKMSRKLARGIGNTLFCWAEVPRSIFKKAYSTDVFTGVFFGIGEGFEQGTKRLGFGLWETATFFSPCNRAYKPYIEPEFVLMDEQE